MLDLLQTKCRIPPEKKKKKKKKKKTNQKKYFLGQRGQLSTIPYNVQVKNKLSGNVTKDI